MTPKRFLQILQQRYRKPSLQNAGFGARPTPGPSLSFDHIDDTRFRAQIATAWAQAYRDKGAWVRRHRQHLLENLPTSINDLCSLKTLIGSSALEIGDLETSDFNASAMCVPGGFGSEGFLITLQSGLSSFLYTCARAIFASSEVSATSGEYHCDPSLPRSDAIVLLGQRLRQYMDIGVCYGKSSPITEIQLKVASMMATAAEQFVLCHELAHVHLGHLKDASARAVPGDWSEANEYSISVGQEMEADWQGAFYLLASHRADLQGLQLAYAGIELFFACAKTVESVTREGDVRMSTHPSPEQRLELTRRMVEETIAPGMGISAEVLTEFGVSFGLHAQEMLASACKVALSQSSPFEMLLSECAIESPPNYVDFCDEIFSWIDHGSPPRICDMLGETLAGVERQFGEIAGASPSSATIEIFHKHKLFISLVNRLDPELRSKVLARANVDW